MRNNLFRALALGMLLVCVGGALCAQSAADGFHPDANDTVHAVLVQPDGRILIGGEFTSIAGESRSYLARLNPDGSLDDGFNPDANGTVRAIALRDDGGILIGGDFTSVNGEGISGVARLDAAGAVVTSFVPNPNGVVYAIAPLDDGGVLIGGDFIGIGGHDIDGVARLDAAGSVVASFAPNPNGNVYTVALRSSGSILIGGDFTNVDGQERNRVARLGETGELDEVFNVGSGPSDTVRTMAPLPDGKILIGGDFTNVHGAARNRIARLNANGSLDSAFNPGAGTGANARVRFIARQADGKILLAGDFTEVAGAERNHVARLGWNGASDHGFRPAADAPVYAVAVQADGSILIAGEFTEVSDVARNRVARVNAHGALDVTLNPGDGPNGLVYSAALQADGKIVIGGAFTQVAGESRNRIARLNADGTLDETFHPGAGAEGGDVRSVAVQPDGKILIGGFFTTVRGQSSRGIARLDSTGALDSNFHPGGGVADGGVYAVAVQADGKIVIGGSFTEIHNTALNRIARLLPGGGLDDSFDIGNGFASGSVFSIAIQPDGAILVGGTFLSFAGNSFHRRVARILENGTADPFWASPIPNQTPRAIAVQPDGKILIGGGFLNLNGDTDHRRFARLQSNGIIDPDFEPARIDGGNVESIVVQADGRILIAGDFTAVQATPRQRVARLHPDGALDTTFNPGANDEILALAPQADGKVVAAGNFTTIDGLSRSRVARFSAAGAAAPRIDYGTGVLTWTLDAVMAVPSRAAFEVSADGQSWAAAGPGAWNGSAWELADVPLALGWNWIRATGWFGDGVSAYSLSFARAFYVEPEPILRVRRQGGAVITNGGSSSVSGTVIGVTTTANFVLESIGTGALTFGAPAVAVTPGAGNPEVVLTDAPANGAVLGVDGTAGVALQITPSAVGAWSVTVTVHSDGSPAGSHVFHVTGSADDTGVIGGGGGGGGCRAAGGGTSALLVLLLLGALAALLRVAGRGLEPRNQGMKIKNPIREISMFRNARYLVVGVVALIAAGSLSAQSADDRFRPNPNSTIHAMAVQDDGRIVIGGAFSSVGGETRRGIARVNPDGSLDTSVPSLITVANQFVYAIAIQEDGRILIGGNFTHVGGETRRRIARLNADGSLDDSFIPADIPTAGGTVVRAAAVQDDGKVLIGGVFTEVGGQPRSGIARLMPNGDLDPNFAPFIVGGLGSAELHSIVVQPDGKILIGGLFQSVDGQTRSCIARLNADGTLDAAFNPGSGAAGMVRAIALQADGKVLIGGDFTQVNGVPRLRIARLLRNGALDGEFLAGSDETVHAVAVQDDGKILVGGQDTPRIRRLHLDGALDESFTPGSGPTGPNAAVHAVATQSDGKILIGGNFTAVSGVSIARMARLYPGGALDGTLATALEKGPDGTVLAMARQADGKILIGGAFTKVDGATRGRLARLNTDGTLDETFVVAVNDTVYAIYIQDDGRILIGGNFTFVNGTSRSRVARLMANGDLDTGFTPPSFFGGNNRIEAIAVQPGDQKILVGGSFTSPTTHIARLNTNGSRDTGFTPPTIGPNWVQSVGLQSDGRIVIGGNFGGVDGVTRRGVARLEVNGPYDPTFGGSGTGALNNTARVVVRPDDKIFIHGNFSSYNGVSQPRLALLTADGEIEAAFSPSVPAGDVTALVLQSDESILIGGTTFTTVNGETRHRIARLLSNGDLDDVFEPTPGASGAVNAILLQPDGKIVIGGAFQQVNGEDRTRVARLDDAGNLDADFKPGVTNGIIRALTRHDNGRVLIGGDFTAVHGAGDFPHLARLERDGVVDHEFLPGVNGPVHAMAVQRDGRIVIVGDFTEVGGAGAGGIFRFNADGTPDAGFNTGTGANGAVYALAIQADGKILIGGDFTSFNGSGRNHVARLNAGGGIDTGFNPGANDAVRAIAVQADGGIILGGDFTQAGGQSRNHVARVDANGALDTGFNPGTNGVVRAIAAWPDGKSVIAGDFTTVGGQTRHRVARLDADGGVTPDFNTAGNGPNDVVRALALQSDGKILIGGDFTEIETPLSTVEVNRVARLQAATGFPDGTSYDPGAGADAPVYAVSLKFDGKLLLGGDFTEVQGLGRQGVARLGNPSAALQSIERDASLTWTTDGAMPMPFHAAFETSADGEAWTHHADADWNGSAWTASAPTIAPGDWLWVRVTGLVNGGAPVSFVRVFHEPPLLELEATMFGPFVPVDVFADAQGPGGIGLVLADVGLTAGSSNVELNSLTFRGSTEEFYADVNTAFSEVALWENNGNGQWDGDVSNTFLGTASFSGGTVTFNLADGDLDADETRRFFLVVKFNGSAPPGHYLGARLDGVDASSPADNVPTAYSFAFQIVSPILHAQRTSSFGTVNVFPDGQGPDGNGERLFRFRLTDQSDVDWTIQELVFGPQGTGNAATAFSELSIWREDGGAEVFVASVAGGFTGGTATINIPDPHLLIPAGEIHFFVLRGKLNGTALPGQTFGAGLTGVTPKAGEPLNGAVGGLPTAFQTTAFTIVAPVLDAGFIGPTAYENVFTDGVGPDGNGELLLEFDLTDTADRDWAIEAMTFEANGSGNPGSAFEEVSLWRVDGAAEELVASVAGGFTDGSVTLGLSAPGNVIGSGDAVVFRLRVKLNGTAPAGVTFGARLVGVELDADESPPQGVVNNIPTGYSQALIIESVILEVRRGDDSPVNPVHASGQNHRRAVLQVALEAMGNTIVVNGLTLTLSGAWAASLVPDGFEVWRATGSVFDPNQDELLFGGDVSGDTVSTAFDLTVANGQVANLWIVGHFDGSAGHGQSTPDYFTAGIAQIGDVSLGSIAEIQFGDPAPESDALGLVEYRVDAFTPLGGTFQGGQSITITGSGFVAPVQVLIGGNPANGTAVISPDGTLVTGLSVPPGEGSANVILIRSAGGWMEIQYPETFGYGPGTTPRGPGGGGCTGDGAPTVPATLGLLALLVLFRVRKRRHA